MLDLNGACANQKTEFGKYSPLTFACTKGSRPLYDLLIERSATIDCYDSFGCTLLHWACSGGNLHLVKDLIKRGQSLKTLDNVSFILHKYVKRLTNGSYFTFYMG
jgi:ankyrin repeat protein